MNKNVMIVATAIAALTVLLGATSATQESPSNQPAEAKSVAWYVANIQAARDQNKTCYDNPELKDTESCQNSLHALQISFKGNN